MGDINRRVRVDQWPSRMRAALERHQREPFMWGASDCARMWGDTVAAVTGENPLAGWRYASERGAVRELLARGYKSAFDFISKNYDEIPPSLARRGDFGFPAEIEGSLMSPAIIDGAVAHSKNESGLVVIPRNLIVRAFAL